ncbi:Ubiquitin-like-conjugating enzyme ATG10 [Cladobotryum mycophilum]|uniref:Ubiquitin-like-conjugating enzyme ATG10 n=1 Tax=Cladobotryum mycophilum TaxID=491253 RepID=A0ABR0SF29_9HYPO
MSTMMDIERFPFLTQEEFAEACHHFDNQYCQATLGPLRKKWKLRLCTALDTMFYSHSGYTTYLQIIRPLEETADPGDISLDLGSFSISEEDSGHRFLLGDDDMMDAEESDVAVISKKRMTQDFGYVTYEIHLHPTYRVPCLWFTLHGLPPDEIAFNIDTVFRHLVPEEYKDGLRREIGGIGGISADHHPITGVPAFFVHPCLLGDAISSFKCSRQNYLMIWLGLVGGCVGLWVPKEMATQ